MISISDIKKEIELADISKRKQIVDKYRNDTRAGVKKLVEKYDKEQEKLKKECERIENMRIYEKKYSEYDYICGIDEVGRGPLSGPVVAAAVILPKDCKILYVNDSKKAI